MKHIVYVSPSSFDSAHTREMADEIRTFNNLLKVEDKSYMLVGPGRWGSSDPWLGIPVAWSDISNAKLIVECAIPGFQIEPSQGTHFFQNLTSLGVGYLNVDTVTSEGSVDFDWLDSIQPCRQGSFVRVIELEQPLKAFIDRNSSSAVVGL